MKYVINNELGVVGKMWGRFPVMQPGQNLFRVRKYTRNPPPFNIDVDSDQTAIAVDYVFWFQGNAIFTDMATAQSLLAAGRDVQLSGLAFTPERDPIPEAVYGVLEKSKTEKFLVDRSVQGKPRIIGNLESFGLSDLKHYHEYRKQELADERKYS